MIVKVCGLREAENIQAVAALGADYMGFICYGPSPRFVGDMDATLLDAIPAHIIKTGVFVNATEAEVNGYIEKYKLNAVQLHGNESPEFCAAFKGRVEVIKAFGVNEEFDFDQLNAYAGVVDMFLFDTKTPVHGGSGQAFNWQLLNSYKLDVPFMLSGGISVQNAAQVAALNHPQMIGVDLNSKFEIKPGLKDIELLKQAFKIFKQI